MTRALSCCLAADGELEYHNLSKGVKASCSTLFCLKAGCQPVAITTAATLSQSLSQSQH